MQILCGTSSLYANDCTVKDSVRMSMLVRIDCFIYYKKKVDDDDYDDDGENNDDDKLVVGWSVKISLSGGYVTVKSLCEIIMIGFESRHKCCNIINGHLIQFHFFNIK